MDAGFGEALIAALAGGGAAVTRHEAARLIGGCLNRLRGRGRAADELAGVLEAFAKGADEEVAKELEALPPAVRIGAGAQVDEALVGADEDPAEAVVTGELVTQAKLIRDELVKAGVLVQSNSGTVVYRPKGLVAIGSDATVIGKLKVKGDVSFGGGRRSR